MKKEIKKKIKAWAVIDGDGKLIVVAHGNAKEEVWNYDICPTKKSGLNCIKYHEGTQHKVIPCEIILKQKR